MIVWRITGNAIGRDDAGAQFFALKADADKALRVWRRDNPGRTGDGPDKIEVNTRDDLVAALHDAIGYGAS